ncbi:MAG: hypothetical protein ACRENE_12575 [Polyangiaceae bacterium]
MKRSLAAVGALTLATTLAGAARADDASPGYSPPHVAEYSGGALPPGGHLERRTEKTLLGSGVVIAGVPYAFSVLYALSTCGAQTDCRAGSQWLYVPFFGPFVTAAQAPTSGGVALSVFDGSLQLLGLGLVVASQVMPRTVVVWQDARNTVRVLPTLMPGGGGLSLTMTSM